MLIGGSPKGQFRVRFPVGVPKGTDEDTLVALFVSERQELSAPTGGCIMSKKLLIATATVISLFLIYFFGSGFGKVSSAYINEYAVSQDGREITMNIGVASSSGYIRKVAVHQQEGGKMYIDCYSAFGGINGSVGAKTVFTLPLDDKTTMIAIYRNSTAYEEVLRKDCNGVWQRIQ